MRFLNRFSCLIASTPTLKHPPEQLHFRTTNWRRIASLYSTQWLGLISRAVHKEIKWFVCVCVCDHDDAFDGAGFGRVAVVAGGAVLTVESVVTLEVEAGEEPEDVSNDATFEVVVMVVVVVSSSRLGLLRKLHARHLNRMGWSAQSSSMMRPL